MEALAAMADGPEVRFVANVDPAALEAPLVLPGATSRLPRLVPILALVAMAGTLPLLASTLIAGTAVDYIGRRRVAMISASAKTQLPKTWSLW